MIEIIREMARKFREKYPTPDHWKDCSDLQEVTEKLIVEIKRLDVCIESLASRLRDIRIDMDHLRDSNNGHMHMAMLTNLREIK